jgi:D-3-phosphoglycerate dehydrogenase
MKVLIADRMPDSVVSMLEKLGATVVSEPDVKDDALAIALVEHNPQVLMVRSTRVAEEHFSAATNLGLVVRAGAGTNTIDLTAASGRAISVANCPGMNADAVAELAMGHIINADRRIADNTAALRAGKWRKKLFSKARGLKGRTLGVLGCGATGAALIERARGFGMRIIAYDPYLSDARAEAMGLSCVDSLIDLAAQSDVMSVHVALTRETNGMVNAEVLAALRPGSIFVNVSRGEVVDEAALAAVVENNGVRAGLDVFQDEPAADGDWKPAIAGLDGVFVTHHIGASTQQAQEAVAADACRIVAEWHATGNVPNCVNLAKTTPADHQLVVRHADQVGVLAGILDLLRQGGINVQQMENVIYAGKDAAACARIQVMGPVKDTLVHQMNADPNVFSVTLVKLDQD